MVDIDVDFYLNEYGGAVSECQIEERFEFLARKAWHILDRMTFYNIRCIDEKNGMFYRREFIEFTENEIKRIKMAMCCLIETEFRIQEAERKALAGNSDSSNVKSRSSGNESITYGVAKTLYDDAISDNAKRDELYKKSIMIYMNPSVFRVNPFYAGWC